MGILDSLTKKKKSIDELEEETENLEAENRKADQELSIEEKRVAIAQLKARGLKPSHFPSWSAIIQWLKTH
jgi:phage gp16-like protein